MIVTASFKIPVLLDTDIGTNVDDALALAYLLRQPRCELVGITTVSGHVAKRAACAEIICRAAGRDDVPIFAGCSDPLSSGPGQPEVPLYDVVRTYAHRLDRPAESAVDFLRESIRSRPGELTIITIGPMTNLATLFVADPGIPSLLAGVVSMAGVYFPHARAVETNCRIDPAAASIVFGTPLRSHARIGLDVTTPCRLPVEDALARIETAGVDPLAEMTRAWAIGRSEVVFNDPLAAATPFHAGLCRYREGRVTVAIEGPASERGRTRFEPFPSSGETRCVATEVDVDAFFAEFFSVISRR